MAFRYAPTVCSERSFSLIITWKLIIMRLMMMLTMFGKNNKLLTYKWHFQLISFFRKDFSGAHFVVFVWSAQCLNWKLWRQALHIASLPLEILCIRHSYGVYINTAVNYIEGDSVAQAHLHRLSKNKFYLLQCWGVINLSILFWNETENPEILLNWLRLRFDELKIGQSIGMH